MARGTRGTRADDARLTDRGALDALMTILFVEDGAVNPDKELDSGALSDAVNAMQRWAGYKQWVRTHDARQGR